MKTLLSLVFLVLVVAVVAFAVDRLAWAGKYADQYGVTAWLDKVGASQYIDRVLPQDGAAAESAEAEAATPGMVVVTGFASPESVVYDAQYDRYLVANVGSRDVENDGFIAALYPDGSVQNMALITGSPEAPLNNAMGTAINAGLLYVADSPFVRVYDLSTRAQVASHEVPNAGLLNDLDVTEDGVIFVTDMGTGADAPDSWAVHMISPDGDVSVFSQGAELNRPNGLEIDAEGRVILAVVAAPQLVILNGEGLVEQTIDLPEGGYDGMVILPDGYITSAPRTNSIYKVGLDGIAAPISLEIASPASLGHDTLRNRLLVPQVGANSVTLLDLDPRPAAAE